MRQKNRLYVLILIALTMLLSLAGSLVCGRLVSPEVNVIPSEVSIGQQAIVEAKISVVPG